jgi:dTDP-glucose 4,6-dehydratase
MKHASDIILKYLGKDDRLVEYHEAQADTTLVKKVDGTKAVRDLQHKTTITLEDGIPRTIEWQKEVYKRG